MSLERLRHLATELSVREAEVSGRILPSAHIFQQTEVTVFEAVVYNPVICLILQGQKEMSVGQQFVELNEGDMLLVSHDLPVASKITQASTERPYQALAERNPSGFCDVRKFVVSENGRVLSYR